MSGSGPSKSWFASCLTSSVLPTPVGPTEDKACGTAAARQVGAAPLDGLCHQMDGLVLTDDLLFQLGFQPGQLDELRLLDLHRRDARPQLDDLGHIVHGHLDLPGCSLLGGQFPLQLCHPGLALCHTLVIDGLVHIGVFHVGLFLLEGPPVPSAWSDTRR